MLRLNRSKTTWVSIYSEWRCVIRLLHWVFMSRLECPHRPTVWESAGTQNVTHRTVYGFVKMSPTAVGSRSVSVRPSVRRVFIIQLIEPRTTTLSVCVWSCSEVAPTWRLYTVWPTSGFNATYTLPTHHNEAGGVHTRLIEQPKRLQLTTVRRQSLALRETSHPKLIWE